MRGKELVTLRSRPLKNGVKSLFLDYTIDGVRYKENLKMYIIPEKDRLDRYTNEETMKLAQAAKARKVLDIESGSVRIVRRSSAPDVLLTDYIEQQGGEYIANGHRSYGQTLQKIANYIRRYPKKVSVQRVDKEYILGLLAFMRRQGLGEATVHMYFSNLNTVLNRAFRAEMIPENPIGRMDKSERPQRPDTSREYLTLDEVRILTDTPCGNETVKRAFLFACFTGLRLSDIETLTWGEVKPAPGGGWQVEERQVKTRRIVYVPLSDNAAELLPPRGEKTARVWQDLPKRYIIGYHLSRWVKRAGINKHITFHCSRHTNATLLLTYGADISTVSELLGHTDIATTRIYAKVVDAKKREAVSLIPRIGES